MQANYVAWAVLACIAYSLVPPLVRVATQEIPSNVAALLSNVVLVVIIAGVVLLSEQDVVTHLNTPSAAYLYLAGIFLGIGILAYYHALELGPVSIVVPIFAMFIVGGSAIGFFVLDESLTLRKVVGITFGIVAIYLISS